MISCTTLLVNLSKTVNTRLLQGYVIVLLVNDGSNHKAINIAFGYL